MSEHPLPAAGAIGVLRRAIMPAVDELLGSIWPTAENSWLTLAELQLSRRGSQYNGPILAVAAFGIAQVCAPWVSADIRLTWSVAIATVAIILHFAAFRMDRLPLNTLEDIRVRTMWQLRFNTVFVLVWCSMGMFLWAPGILFDHMFIALILACSLAGAISMNAMHPASALIMIVCHAAFLITPFALSSEPFDHTLAWLSTAFVAMMTIQITALHASYKKMLTLEHERSGIVESLRLAKQESDRDRTRAVSAGRAKSQFLSNMNHELRTPMNAILGFSELIEQKAFGAAVDKYAEYAGIIHLSGKHLLRLIDDMLSLAKIEGGKLGLRESEFDLALLLGEVHEENESKAAEAHLTLVKNVAAGIPRVYADERALRQIAINLMSNALKFTPAGGRVTLFAQMRNDGRLAFGVADTGIGIEDDAQAHVFERFGQGRHDVTSPDKGTGLGLAIVKGFAEAHDGEVKLESALGMGTRVTTILPLDRLRSSAVRLSA